MGASGGASLFGRTFLSPRGFDGARTSRRFPELKFVGAGRWGPGVPGLETGCLYSARLPKLQRGATPPRSRPPGLFSPRQMRETLFSGPGWNSDRTRPGSHHYLGGTGDRRTSMGPEIGLRPTPERNARHTTPAASIGFGPFAIDNWRNQ